MSEKHNLKSLLDRASTFLGLKSPDQLAEYLQTRCDYSRTKVSPEDIRSWQEDESLPHDEVMQLLVMAAKVNPEDTEAKLYKQHHRFWVKSGKGVYPVFHEGNRPLVPSPLPVEDDSIDNDDDKPVQGELGGF